ncbi:SDR family NAD(P)-dependent oxidoreductase [Virgibacillus ihumii]|uniref:SDR family NAD(P)-dependent oxidoreductase n=1 Tax=Virgibacillus ihumii TaxID=2686091 RepID=UPI00157D6403|nr:SDR family NAD(P)-dependent oxidoreductase [Virgibacillus ihumii]
MKVLKGKIAIVTGASRAQGIGYAICLMHAKADIFFTHWSTYDKSEGVGSEKKYQNVLYNKIRNLGVRCEHIEADLSRPETPTNILNQVEETLGTPSVLINNATYEKLVDFRTLDAEVLEKHYKVNNSGTLVLSTEFAKRFENAFPNKEGGRIINFVLKPNLKR